MAELLEATFEASVSCERCGQLINANTVATRRLRGNEDKRCADCNRRPATVISYGSTKCTPWNGEVDLNTMKPIKNGKPYLPGERSCGHNDCIRLDHIVRETVDDGFKVCTVCLETLPIEEFGIDRKKKDGRNCTCKGCRRIQDAKSKQRLEALTAEQLSLFYRTGKNYSYKQLVKKLEKERIK